MECIMCGRRERSRRAWLLLFFFVASVTSLTASGFVLVAESQQGDVASGSSARGYLPGNSYVYEYTTQTGSIMICCIHRRPNLIPTTSVLSDRRYPKSGDVSKLGVGLGATVHVEVVWANKKGEKLIRFKVRMCIDSIVD